MRTDVPVVVLKLRPYPLHAGTIGIARSMGRLGVGVHVIGEAHSSPVARSRYVATAVCPPHTATSSELARWIAAYAPAQGALLIAVDDLASVFVQLHADILATVYRYPMLPTGLVERLVDKADLADLARQAKVPSPAHAAPATRAELDACLAQSRFPVVVKMRDPALFERTHGVRGVEIGDSADEVRGLWTRHLVDGQPNCILQEYIPGGPDTVWMINGYVDRESTLRFAATGRKLRQFLPYTGATSLGICERNPEVLALTAQLVRSIGYRGIIDIGWRYDARDGRYKLLDFNPRIGATFRLFTGRGGLDVARACYLDLTEQDGTGDDVRDGRKWMNDSYDLYSAAKYIADGNLSTSDALRSFAGVEEAAWLAADDLRPVAAMVRDAASMALGAARKRALVTLQRRSASRHHQVVGTQA